MDNSSEKKKRLKTLFALVGVLSVILVAYFFVYTYIPKFTLKCVFHEITNLKCPGCGITRMFVSFARLEFIKGIKYNIFLGITIPFVIGIITYNSYLYVANKKSNKIFNIICYVYIFLLLIWGIVRNIIGM